ncbi:class I SAM-dependent methyltransferase [Nitrospirillum viridazoti]|uniref:Methyltransferase type 11 domain-containing protein n=1 Tax=Nitrospirillum viridazoti CBAmc TaxID=1441467 RepID=A0A248JS82_9PROT|nr:methyltransferase domain-containing protein [Nitrospirillum amazonense]ASG21370.1 hypothetical protein Y958_11435 [Nitrospirillum amazonense CBAmc]TWB33046.1 methyltransferase family protein [Nitrospirillum amazonense]
MDPQWMTLSNTFKKYNLGCGTMLYRGFLNIGYWPNLQNGGVYQNLNNTDGTFMMNHDLREGIPALDGSLDLIYHSHFLEHISYTDGITFLKECYAKLADGGKMRILVPDLEKWAKAYLNNDRFFLEEYVKEALDPALYVTNAAIFMGMLHNHDHRCGYDFDTLKWVLEHVGFTHVKKTLYASSEYVENIFEIEPQQPVRIMESLCVECRK